MMRRLFYQYSSLRKVWKEVEESPWVVLVVPAFVGIGGAVLIVYWFGKMMGA